MVGGRRADREFRLPRIESCERFADNFRRARGLAAGGTRLRALAPGAKMPAKRWPAERFAECVRVLLAERPELVCIVFGDRSDAALGAAIEAAAPGRVVNIAGTVSVMESAALLRRCHAFIGNDTGTMHLAAMAGCPGVALFSSRDYPGRWEPAGAPMEVLRSPIDCEGCMLIECRQRDNECLKRIAPVAVIERSRRMLDRKGAPPCEM